MLVISSSSLKANSFSIIVFNHGARLLTFYSFELKLPEVLNPSLRVHGDTKLEGDLYIQDAEKNENYIFGRQTIILKYGKD